jgi:hypothetical protein
MLGDIKRRAVVEKSDSPWSLHVMLFWKDGVIRICMDYEKLDDITKDCFLLPRIDDTLDTLAGPKWFSTLDLLCCTLMTKSSTKVMGCGKSWLCPFILACFSNIQMANAICPDSPDL